MPLFDILDGLFGHSRGANRRQSEIYNGPAKTLINNENGSLVLEPDNSPGALVTRSVFRRLYGDQVPQDLLYRPQLTITGDDNQRVNQQAPSPVTDVTQQVGETIQPSAIAPVGQDAALAPATAPTPATPRIALPANQTSRAPQIRASGDNPGGGTQTPGLLDALEDGLDSGTAQILELVARIGEAFRGTN